MLLLFFSAEEIDDQEDMWEERTREIQFANASEAGAVEPTASGKPASSNSSSSSSSSDEEGESGGGVRAARIKKNRKRKSNEQQMEVDQSKPNLVL